jgi:site-specific DNA-methyltransferase (adenine-specific)
MEGVRLIVGDCVEGMRQMDSQSVNCCVTSPPYFGLRDYGIDGQLGVEATPDQYVAGMVKVFSEVYRVLRDDGTLWLNIGDSYYNHRTGHGGGMPGQSFHAGQQLGKPDKVAGCLRRATKLEGIREKELIGIPWMLAFALRSSGWLIRQEIIWNKPNPTPEKVTDRCTRSHEHIFLLTKKSHYWFDYEPIMEIGENGEPRRKRSVWTVQTRRFKGAHFATFPPELIEPCVLAGCPVGGTVLDPFGGSGTTAAVASRNGRKSIICEINPEFSAMTPRRVIDCA